MMTSDQKQRVAALAVALALPVVAGLEGVRQYAYRDPVGIPTYCFGETKNVEWGRRYSMDECRALLSARVAEAVADVQSCVSYPVKPHELAALGSFAYNVGRARFCGSTLARRANRGELPAACSEFDKWTYARGVQLPGLINRRRLERQMCEGQS